MATLLNKSITDMEQFLIHCHRRRYSAKSTIIYAGETGDSLYYIVSGSITVLIEDDDGKEMIVAYLKDGDFFGEMGLFDKKYARSAWIRAKSHCEVAEISYVKFQELSALQPELLFALELQMARRLRTTTRKVLDLAFLDVAGRIASTLVDLCSEPGAIEHPMGTQLSVTRYEIALVVGCSREMVGRVLKTMEDQGLLSAKGKTMVVYGAYPRRKKIG